MAAAAVQVGPPGILAELLARFEGAEILPQSTVDGIPTAWLSANRLREVLAYLARDAKPRYEMLYDLTAIDETLREHRAGQPSSDVTMVYHLTSYARNEDLRLKVALAENSLSVPSVCRIYPNADWYECEVYDLFGVDFSDHPRLRRLIMPPTWEGHPLRKSHPARATEMEPYRLWSEKQDQEQEALRFDPEYWGMKRSSRDADFMFLNLGPNHPSVHGVFRICLQLDGEEVLDAVPDIGYHHRGAEKMGERQSWHSYIPYTDRIDYLGGVMNNLPYVMSVEQLAGITVPPRAQVIRVMMAELFRVASHLVFYGTFAQDVGALSPVFYMFADRERIFDIVQAICGGRMHPSWFRIGGVAHDLPRGWDRMIREFLDWMPKRMREYDSMVMDNRILRKRTVGIGTYTTEEAFAWGATGAGLRATGFEWDYRKERPYSGYDQFEFDVPTGTRGDTFDRAAVRVEEIRQSLRIIRQCLNNMPGGPIRASHPLTCPPPKERTMHDIETLITHFLNVSWGPVIPAGESCVTIEATKGLNSYYLVSDGGTMSYRTRIRTPSFPHLQMIPLMTRGLFVADLIAIIASIDFVMADVDR